MIIEPLKWNASWHSLPLMRVIALIPRALLGSNQIIPDLVGLKSMELN